MFIVQGAITCFIGVVTYWWMVDFPENAHRSFMFLSKDESAIAASRIQKDRSDVHADPFAINKVLVHALDPKVYGLCCLFFLQNVVSTALAYFLPIILQSGMGFSSNASILLSAPPYYYAVVPALLSSLVGDKYRMRAPIITFNCVCVVVGFCMLGLADQVTVRYIGTYLATGAYVANWAALMAYQANNIVGYVHYHVSDVHLLRRLQAVEAGVHRGDMHCIQRSRGHSRQLHSAQQRSAEICYRRLGLDRVSQRVLVAKSLLISCDSSHLLMIGIVMVFSVYFMVANRAQQRGMKILEATVSSRHQVCPRSSY